MWFYHTVSWFIKTKGLEPVRSRRLQERERNEARLDKPSMQRALTRDSLHNLRCHVAASLFGLPLFRMKKRLRISDCRSFPKRSRLHRLANNFLRVRLRRKRYLNCSLCLFLNLCPANARCVKNSCAAVLEEVLVHRRGITG